VSSTYYDLKYIRNDLERFILDYGFESVLFENGGITFKKGEKIDESCYREIGNCHLMVLIIGGRYGSPATEKDAEIFKSDYEKFVSITLKEYRTANTNNIPIYVFIDKNVDTEYSTYKKNGFQDSKIKFAFADDINVYNFINEIYKSGLYVFKFENFQDIKQTLKDQWAGLMYEYLLSLQKDVEIDSLSTEVSKLHTISEKMNVAIEGLVEKLLEGDSAKKASIKEKQEKVDMDNLLVQINRAFDFRTKIFSLSKDERVAFFGKVLNTYINCDFRANGIKEFFAKLDDKDDCFTGIASNTNTLSSIQKSLSELSSEDISRLANYMNDNVSKLSVCDPPD
jgi:hypothetical protein